MHACARALLVLACALALTGPATARPARWSERDVRILASLRLVHTPPRSPSNRVADDPRAASLGRRIFFDSGFSPGGDIACASCHLPGLHFTDGKPRSVVAPAGRNAPSVVGAAYGRWFYWDGRRDSLWAQALVPFEAPSEIGGSRLGVLRRIAGDSRYRAEYEALFGALPNLATDAAGRSLPAHAGPLGDDAARKAWQRIPRPTRDAIDRAYANVGKAVEAYERTLLPRDSRFDRFVDAVRAGDAQGKGLLSASEVAGLRLFIDPGRTQCMQCHNGPLLTNGGFHNIGTGSFAGTTLDFGRALGVQAALIDAFNCRGDHSDVPASSCAELNFLTTDDHTIAGSFKTPSLRDVHATGPYMHDGRFATLTEVLRFYSAPPSDTQPHELRALDLSERELGDLEAFLRALASEKPASDATWSDSERFLLGTLRWGAIGAPPPDPGNPHGDDPAAAALGAALFADPGLSGNGKMSCASCHDPARGFSDGRRRSLGLGPLPRNAPSLLNVAFDRWLYRDGRVDSLWAQALVPIEHPSEMGGSRDAVVRHVARDARLRALYRAAFGSEPAEDSASGGSESAAFVRIGQALAAYERTLRTPPTRFDAYVDAVLEGRASVAAQLLDAREVAGLRLFLSGRTGCLGCHVGPRFSDGRFHNVGTSPPGGDRGREAGIEALRNFEFRCAAHQAPGAPGECPEPELTEVPELWRGAFKTPGLRGLNASAPYMHDGRFSTLEEVLDFYRDPPNKREHRHELPARLDLTDAELDDLAQFLRALGAL